MFVVSNGKVPVNFLIETMNAMKGIVKYLGLIESYTRLSYPKSYIKLIMIDKHFF